MRAAITAHMRIFQLTGSLPLVLDEPSFSEVSKPCMVLSLALISLCLTKLLFLTPPDISRSGPATQLAFIVANLALCLLPIVHSLNIIMWRFPFEDTLNNIILIQRRFGLKSLSYFPCHLPFFIAMGVLLLASFTFHNYQNGNYTMSTFMDDLFWNYCYMYQLSISSQLSFLQHLLGKCFRKLRCTKFGRTRLLVKDTIVYYHVIMDICCVITAVYHWSISLILLAMFCSMLATTAGMIVAPYMDLYSCGQYAIWILHHVLATMHILGSCHFLTERAEECNDALVSYIIHNKSESYQDNSLVMIHLSSRKTLQFTACKCVNVDYRLGLSMIAAFLTYVVVLFQIENNDAAGRTTTMLSNHNRTSA